jgi:hypothetical protein
MAISPQILSNRTAEDQEFVNELKQKVSKWKSYRLQNAEEAGFRKASIKKSNSLTAIIARSTAEAALKYDSPYLRKLASLLNAASKDKSGKLSNKVLQRLSENEGYQNTSIQKPTPQIQDQAQNYKDESLAPNTTSDGGKDNFWSCERMSSSKVDVSMVSRAREFLEDVMRQRGMTEPDEEFFQEEELKNGFIVQVRNEGEDIGAAMKGWDVAKKEMVEELNPESATGLVDQEPAEIMSYKGENFGRKASKDEIVNALDHCLDFYSSDLVPSEITPEHVKDYITENYPNVNSDEVYELIQEIIDRKVRHKEDEAEKESAKSKKISKEVFKKTDPVSSYLRSSNVKAKVVCANCHGSSSDEKGICAYCDGKGCRDELVSKKYANLAGKVALTIPYKNLSQVNKILGIRLASRNTIVVATPELMTYVKEKGIPYLIMGYKHPRFNLKKNKPVNTPQ